MNRLEIRTEVRRILAQTSLSATYFSEDDLNAWIVEGMREMCVKAGVYVTSTPLTVTDGQATYLLPWNVINVKNILRPSNVPLTAIGIDMLGATFKISGLPNSFYITIYPLAVWKWTASTTYSTWSGTPAGCYITPTALSGYMQECVVTGVSGTSEPTWPTIPSGQTPAVILGKTTTDNTVTWKQRELISAFQQLTLVDTPLAASGGTGTYTIWYTSQDDGLPDDTSSPHFPEDKQHLLVPYVAYRAAVKMKQQPLAMNFYQEFATPLGIATTTGAQG